MVLYLGLSKRLTFFLAVLFVIAGITSASAQGLMPALPGLPGLPGIPLLSQSGCGGKGGPAIGPAEFYVGWMEDRQGISFSVNNTGSVISGLVDFRRSVPLRGLWVGLSESVKLSDKLAIMASGWYLCTSVTYSGQTYTESSPNLGLTTFRRSWDEQNSWWFVDGLVCFGSPTGLNLLVGGRYDEFTTHFKNPYDVSGVATNSTDTADVTSYAAIPLIGTQWAYATPDTSLVFRAVGMPVLLGWVKYNETFGAATRAEARGNFENGYFLEFFSEYAKRFGAGQLGVFGRYNLTGGKAMTNFQVSPGGSARYEIDVNRSSWTLGGVATFAFNTPL